jgi:hypothetical protein
VKNPIINDEMQSEANIITPASEEWSIFAPTAVIVKAGPEFIQKQQSLFA